jgi:catechol 2,3-dioxygenase-like lactoylglutathione lyase family enzyme
VPRTHRATDEFPPRPSFYRHYVSEPTKEFIVDYKFELVVVPVTDVDRAKAFYEKSCGFNVDVDHAAGEDFRVVQLTPPGSACSVTIGKGLTDAMPGCFKGLHLMVTDIEAARAEMVERGVEVAPVRHMVNGEWTPGPDPNHADYDSFAEFADPDGNTWVLQERGYSAS